VLGHQESSFQNHWRVTARLCTILVGDATPTFRGAHGKS